MWRRFVLGEALGSGVSRGVAAGRAPSSSPDFCVDESSFANFAFGMTVRAFSGLGEARFFFSDFRVAAFPLAVGVWDFLGLGDEAACFSVWSD